MNICDKLDYFFETLISEKNFSLNSVDAYKRDLMQLFKDDLNIDLQVIDENYVVKYLNSLKEKKNFPVFLIGRKTKNILQNM